jgi:hypothetical protein
MLSVVIAALLGAAVATDDCHGPVVPDVDGDGLSDQCELFLATRFAPELRADTADCSWIGSTRMLAGGYFHVVHPLNASGDSVRVAYLPAYFNDCGWRGFQRAIRLGRGNAHAGDSEIIVVDVRRVADSWETTGVFLSAHCFGRSDGRCRWFRDRELEQFEWTPGPRGAPRVWIARDKHASYPSRGACESGHWSQEHCGKTGALFRYPVAPDQNLGTRARSRFGPQGCVRSEQLRFPPANTQPDTTECFWSTETPFRGWLRSRPGSSTPYGLILRRIAGL